MKRNGLTLGKILGFEIFVDYSWVLIFVLISWILGTSYFPAQTKVDDYFFNLGLGIVTALLFFICAVIHELSHSIVARRSGIKIKRITLFLFGAISELFEEPKDAETEFKVAIVGPLTSMALTVIFGIIWYFSQENNWPLFIIALSSALFQINLALSLFNLLPGFPLDGGRILRSIFWASGGDLKRATAIASKGGQFVAFMLILLGILEIIISGFWGGIWLILVGLFLNQAAKQSYLELKIREILSKIRISALIRRNILFIHPNLSVNEAISEYFLKYASRSFPVVENEKTVGLITFDDIRNNANDLDENSRVKDIMRSFPSRIHLELKDSVLRAFKVMISEELMFIPVMEKNKIIGAITLDDIAHYLSDQNVI